MFKQSEWQTLPERPGWLGWDRPKRVEAYNQRFGEGNWRIRHILGPRVMDFDEAVGLYELSYELHYLNPHHRFLWNNLFKTASEVWTEDVSDVNCGVDYHAQNVDAAHYEDIAIRRIMKKYERVFTGNRLVRIRADATDSNLNDVVGVALSSVHVPFIFREFIEAPLSEIIWWNRHKGSLEEFWHTNKVLQVKKGSLVDKGWNLQLTLTA